MELIGAQVPVVMADAARRPRPIVEAGVDLMGLRITEPRDAHHREGHERFTLAAILAEERAVLDLVDGRDKRAALPEVTRDITAGLSADQAAAVANIAVSEQLVCPLSAPAGAGKTTSMRALREAAHRGGCRVIVVAPTGQAVDVAVREGAADAGFTVAKALQDLRSGELTLDARHLLIIDEAGMVGTDDLRQLLTATTAARVKVVPVGDAYQLGAVKARSGVFGQLVEDLDWTQKLSEVWRMKDPDERAASAALGRGGPGPRHRAVAWYAGQGRLHCGDDVTMSEDAKAAWFADKAAGKDALLIADRVAECDALNIRIHNERVGQDAETVVAARGHELGTGDVVITRCNDARITVDDATILQAPDPVRNGNRWTVTVADAEHDLIVARRLSDNARAVFGGDYLREHVQLGYAVTVHSAQGVTADSVHAVVSETTTRSRLYVAMTRGRHDNQAYVYGRLGQENEHERPEQTAGERPARRGDALAALRAVQRIVARDDRTRTAHQVAALAEDRRRLPENVREFLTRRDEDLTARRASWLRHEDDQAAQRRRRKRQARRMDEAVREGDRKRDRAYNRGLEL